MLIDEIINRMVAAAGVNNQAQLAAYINKHRSTVSGWKARQTVPDDMIEIVALKSGVRFEWIKTGEGEMKSNLVVESPATDHAIDGCPLSSREKNEVTILRWLEQHQPDTRDWIADEIVEYYILGVKEREKEDGL